jgi:hypothetical protein
MPSKYFSNLRVSGQTIPFLDHIFPNVLAERKGTYRELTSFLDSIEF